MSDAKDQCAEVGQGNHVRTWGVRDSDLREALATATKGQRAGRLRELATEILKVDRRGKGRNIRRRLERDARELRELKAKLAGEAKDRGPQGIYVIGPATGEGPVKIGIAADVAKRLRGIQTGSPVPLKVFYFSAEIALGRAAVVEKLCHEALVDHRLSGEWFDLTPREAIPLVRDIRRSQRPQVVEPA